MLLLNQLFKFFKLIHSETSTRQLSMGFGLGMFIGLTPLFSLCQVIFWLLFLTVRINLGATFISIALFKMVAILADEALNTIGLQVLRLDALEPLWTVLYNSPVVPYSFFYNSVVMGSLITSTLLAVPLYYFSGYLITQYRVTVVRRFKATWLFRAWMSSKLYSIYVKYTEFKDL